MQNPFRIFNRPLTFRQLLWLIPLVLTVHNAEEALTMPHWVMENLADVHRAIPFGIDIQFSPSQLLASLFVATLVPFIVTVLCVGGVEKGKRVYLLFLLQAIVLLNVFIPHLSWSVRTLQYNPGLITAFFINLPFSIYFFHRGYREARLDKRTLVWIFILAAAIYPIVAWLLHSAGEIVARVLSS